MLAPDLLGSQTSNARGYCEFFETVHSIDIKIIQPLLVLGGMQQNVSFVSSVKKCAHYCIYTPWKLDRGEA